MRVMTVGSLPPEWGGPMRGGVATFHAALLEGLLDADEVELVGVLPPAPSARELPLPLFTRPPETGVADFYEQTLDRLRPDVVVMNHVANTVGVTHARLGSPVPAVGIVHSWHNITFAADADEQERGLAVTQEALDGLRTLVVPSRHCEREGRALGLDYPALTEVIHYPLQPLYLEDPGGLDAYERSGVAFVGSLIARKRPEALVEAAALLPDVELTLVGDGELAASLAARAGELADAGRVRVGALPDERHLERVRELLLTSEVLCLPSRSESFGIVFIEALACGTPVVGFAATVREIGEAMGMEVGVAVDDGSPRALADAIAGVLARPWDRERLRSRAVEAFGLARATERYVASIAGAIQEHGVRLPR